MGQNINETTGDSDTTVQRYNRRQRYNRARRQQENEEGKNNTKEVNREIYLFSEMTTHERQFF